METQTTDPRDLIPSIIAKHKAVVAARESQLSHAIECGELLIAAKTTLRHGEWAAWLETNCPEISDRTARLYMKLAEGKSTLQQLDREIGNGVANLSIREAVRTTSKPCERRASVALQGRGEGKSKKVSSLPQSDASIAALAAVQLSPAESDKFAQLVRNTSVDTLARLLKESLSEDDLAVLIDRLMQCRPLALTCAEKQAPMVQDGVIVSNLMSEEPRKGNPPPVILALVTRLLAA